MPGPFLNTGPFSTFVTDVNATPQEELGVWRFENGKVYKYVKAANAIARYDAVKHDSAVTSVTAALVGNQVTQTLYATDMFLGVADGATMSSGQYGWITIYGMATARVAAGEVPNSPIGPSANTGVLSIRNTSHFNAAAIAVASGLSAGSTIFVSVL